MNIILSTTSHIFKATVSNTPVNLVQ